MSEGIDFNEGLYAEAENLMGFNVKALQAMALLAYENRKDKEALRVLSFVWGRSSKAMARAVERYPMYFESERGMLEVVSPDELLAVFLLGTLGPKESAEMFEQWRKYTLRAWQLRERIDAMREAKRDKRTKPYKFESVHVTFSDPNGWISFETEVPSGFKSGKYDVTLRPVAEKKAKPKKSKK